MQIGAFKFRVNWNKIGKSLVKLVAEILETVADVF